MSSNDQLPVPNFRIVPASNVKKVSAPTQPQLYQAPPTAVDVPPRARQMRPTILAHRPRQMVNNVPASVRQPALPGQKSSANIQQGNVIPPNNESSVRIVDFRGSAYYVPRVRVVPSSHRPRYVLSNAAANTRPMRYRTPPHPVPVTCLPQANDVRPKSEMDLKKNRLVELQFLAFTLELCNKVSIGGQEVNHLPDELNAEKGELEKYIKSEGEYEKLNQRIKLHQNP